MNARRIVRNALTGLGLGWPAYQLAQHIEPTTGTRQMLIYLAIFLPTWTTLSFWLASEPTGRRDKSTDPTPEETPR
jgi:hypothetical protein